MPRTLKHKYFLNVEPKGNKKTRQGPRFRVVRGRLWSMDVEAGNPLFMLA